MTSNETLDSGLLDKRHIIAKAGFNRWLVPPAALAIHLCIGMAYGFSVFWLPLSQAIGITKPFACAAGLDIWHMLFTTSCDWKVADLGWMYTLFFVLLGSSAAIWGGWLERVGVVTLHEHRLAFAPDHQDRGLRLVPGDPVVKHHAVAIN